MMTTTARDWLLIRGGAQFRNSSGISVEKEDEIFSSLLRFLNEKGLLKNQLLQPGEAWEGFEIRQSHLTDVGWSLMAKAVPKWLASIDRGRDPSDVSLLMKALPK